MIRTAILCVDDSTVSGGNCEAAAAAVRTVLAGSRFTEVDFQVVPDEQAIVRARLRIWADEGSADLVLTLGCIGAGIRHRTPDATREVIDREYPGIAEVLRSAGAQLDPLAGLWRSVAGSRRRTAIANLPDGAAALSASLGAALPLLEALCGSLAEQADLGAPPAGRGPGRA